MITRREFLATAAVVPIAAATRPSIRVVVIGAGAFGGWTALHLLRSGARVTLIDAWGAGNSRASSGGETRVIRAIYGGDPDYTRWVQRSFVLWRDAMTRSNLPLYTRTGALWMFGADDKYARDSLPVIRNAGLIVDELTVADASKRYPQVNFDGVRSVYFEHEAGYLLARRSCQVVQQMFEREGGTFRIGSVQPPAIKGAALTSVTLTDGTSVTADAFVFACGPWLGKVFPEVIGNFVAPSRQEVFFFGPPAGDRRFVDFPVWVDFGERLFYGIPAAENRGFKIADDTRGDPVDPTTLDRVVSADALARAREKVAQRFPSLSGAPLVESRVCQYENSPDGHFIIDRHPAAANVFIAGGGSGHGYKLSPALGEYVAGVVRGRRKLMERFRLSRLHPGEKTKTQTEHS